jgi:aquaporin Z
MAYALGPVSGCHLNPAVTCGLVVGGRFRAADAVPYVIASGRAGFEVTCGLAANGYGAHSPGGYSLMSGFVTEVVMTFMFLLIILGATDARAPEGFAPIAIGLGLTLIHLVSIPVTNTSVNPARSTGPAVIVSGWALSQLRLFRIAPLLGAVCAGLGYRLLAGDETQGVAGRLREVTIEQVTVGIESFTEAAKR